MESFYKSKWYKDGRECYCIVCRKLMRIKNEQRIRKEQKISVVPKYRICRVCNIKQKTSNFNIALDRKSGYRNECKSCQKGIHEQYVNRIQQENKNLPTLKSKMCHDCGKRKGIKSFAKNSHSKDGYGSQCRICRKAYHQTLLDKDPDYDKKRSARRRNRPEVRAENKIRNRKWRKDNAEQHRENSRLWKEKEGNKERASKRQREWSKTEAGKRSIRVSHMNRRNHRKLDKAIILEIENENKALYGLLTCVYCKQVIKDNNYHSDHMLPIARGGNNVKENLCIACAVCNQSKRTMTSEEFFKSDRLKRILRNQRLKRIA